MRNPACQAGNFGVVWYRRWDSNHTPLADNGLRIHVIATRLLRFPSSLGYRSRRYRPWEVRALQPNRASVRVGLSRLLV